VSKPITLDRPRYCEVTDRDGDECGMPVTAGAPISICVKHAAQVWEYVEDAKRSVTAEPPVHLIEGRASAVYYIRFENRVKIGTSRDLPARLGALPHDEILAIEPGGHSMEHLRHLQFSHLRTNGEWFLVDPELRRHIIGVRAKFGSPLAAWKAWKDGERASTDKSPRFRDS